MDLSFPILVCLFVIVFQQHGSELVVGSSEQDNHMEFHRLFSNTYFQIFELRINMAIVKLFKKYVLQKILRNNSSFQKY